MMNLSQLEAASDAATEARDAAQADLDKIDALIAALVLAEDHACDKAIHGEVRRMLRVAIDWTAIARLRSKRTEMGHEVDRLDDLRSDAEAALNSAEEAA